MLVISQLVRQIYNSRPTRNISHTRYGSSSFFWGARRCAKSHSPLTSRAVDDSSSFNLTSFWHVLDVTVDSGVYGMMQPGLAPWQQFEGRCHDRDGSTSIQQWACASLYVSVLLLSWNTYTCQVDVAQRAVQVVGEGLECSFSVLRMTEGAGATCRWCVWPVADRRHGHANMGMLTPPNQWTRSSAAFPGATALVYHGFLQSEVPEAWGMWSVHWSFVLSFELRVPHSVASTYGGSSRPRAWKGVAPPLILSGWVDERPGKSPARSQGAPLSWKNGW